MMMRARTGGSTATTVVSYATAAGASTVASSTAADADPVEVAASEALVAISTMGRDVPYARVRELVETVLRSHTQRQHLPVLIMWMRNHSKSRAAGTGMGERSTPMHLLVALYECDAPVALALLKDMTLYGSWRSLMVLLDFTDNLCAAGDGDDTAAIRFGQLHQAVHAVFARQLRTDLDSLAAGGGVSNASKYAPHEGRNATLKRHGDAIAALLFPDAASQDKAHLRRLYRQARVSLNECNQHIAEIYLAGGRAGELLPGMICSGTYDKLRKALLNVDTRGKERHADEPRRLLRKRILERLTSHPSKIPAPSDLAELANKLLALHHDTEFPRPGDDFGVDEGERMLLGVQYANAVRSLREAVADRSAEFTALIRQAGLTAVEEEAALAAATAVPTLLAIDTTLSQKGTLPTACLLALVLADSLEEQEVPIVFFGDGAHVYDVPKVGDVEKRLAALLEFAKQEAAGGVAANYGAVFSLLDADDRLAGRDVVVCSDFQDPEHFAGAVRAWREASGSSAARVVSCWRFLNNKAGRRRERQPAWDAENRRVDLVFMLDTTGSMGGEIHFCQQQVSAICGKLMTIVDMPVSVAFVSYKDFGDDGHLEVYDWVDVTSDAGMRGLTEFIGTLRASGGGDAPEDVAGGFDKVNELFRRRTLPSLRMCLWMADAPCHGRGLNSGGDYHSSEGGVDQAERTLALVREVFGQGRAELLFAKCAGGYDVEKMVKAFDSELGKYHTFVDEFAVDRSSDLVFKEKILSSLESCVAQAIAPPTEGLGLDLFAGTDFSVPVELACRRISDQMNSTMASAGEKRNASDIAAGVDDGKDPDGAARPDKEEGEGMTKEGGRTSRSRMSALTLLLLKLSREEYDVVRASVSGVQEGLFKDYQWCKPLTEASMEVLQKAGLSVADLHEADYPSVIVAQYQEFLSAKMSNM